MSPRKKLNENEDAFIKGNQPSSQPAAKPTGKQTTTTDEALSKILSPAPPAPKDPTIRFTADLPVELHRRLTLAAAKAGKKKVDIVRELLEHVLPAEQ